MDGLETRLNERMDARNKTANENMQAQFAAQEEKIGLLIKGSPTSIRATGKSQSGVRV